MLNKIERQLILIMFKKKLTSFLGLLKVNKLPCIPIPKTLNGEIKYSDVSATVYASKTTATLQCNPGFVPIGAAETTCNNGGKLFRINEGSNLINTCLV